MRTYPLKQCWTENGVGIVPLTQGFVTTVDAEDLPWITENNWYAMPSIDRKRVTAGRCVGVKPNRKTVYLHRVLLNAPDHLEVDHVDGNPLNNRRSNLRLATEQENSRNRRVQENDTGYKGVKRCRNRFVSRITTEVGSQYLGLFSTAVEAARAYNIAAIAHFGPFAKLNGNVGEAAERLEKEAIVSARREKRMVTSKTGFIGVYPYRNTGKFIARIPGKDGKHIGIFDTALEAARAYDAEARKRKDVATMLNEPNI